MLLLQESFRQNFSTAAIADVMAVHRLRFGGPPVNKDVSVLMFCSVTRLFLLVFERVCKLLDDSYLGLACLFGDEWMTLIASNPGS